jgi:hypothetical protein
MGRQGSCPKSRINADAEILCEVALNRVEAGHRPGESVCDSVGQTFGRSVLLYFSQDSRDVSEVQRSSGLTKPGIYPA